MASLETQPTLPGRRSRNAIREKSRRRDAPTYTKSFPTVPEPMESLQLPPPLLPLPSYSYPVNLPSHFSSGTQPTPAVRRNRNAIREKSRRVGVPAKTPILPTVPEPMDPLALSPSFLPFLPAPLPVNPPSHSSSRRQPVSYVRRSCNAIREKLRRPDAPICNKTFPTVPETLLPLRFTPPVVRLLPSFHPVELPCSLEPHLLSVISEESQQGAEDEDCTTERIPLDNIQNEVDNSSDSFSCSVYSCGSADYGAAYALANGHISCQPSVLIEYEGVLWESLTELGAETSVSNTERRWGQRTWRFIKRTYSTILRQVRRST